MAKKTPIYVDDLDWKPSKAALRPPPRRPTPIRHEVMNRALLDLIYDLGGCRVVAKALKVHPSTVSRWTAPKEIGCNGRPPVTRLAELFKLADKAGIEVDKSRVLKGAGIVV